MHRRTKIVATLGPATDREGVLEALIVEGINVARMNFSHGSPQDHQRRVSQVRKLAQNTTAMSRFWVTCKARKSVFRALPTVRSP